MEKYNVTGILLLAGDSTRYGDTNKNLELLSEDKTVLEYSLDVFNNNEIIDDIILVAREEDLGEVYSIIEKYDELKPVRVVIGGKTRMDSVYNALTSTDSMFVIIHDAARPFIKDEYINGVFDQLDSYWGASIGVKSRDTVKVTGSSNLVDYTTDRNNTWIVQTPQAFDREMLLRCHDFHSNDMDITDDCMLLEREGLSVKMVEGDYTNIKITTKDDLAILKSLEKIKVKKMSE